MVVVYSVMQFYSNYSLEHNGIEVTGVITEIDHHQVNDPLKRPLDIIYTTIEFETSEGKVSVVKPISQLDFETTYKNRIKVGGTLEIKYLESDPNRNEIL